MPKRRQQRGIRRWRPGWARWRRARYVEFLHDGVPHHLAWRLATGEAWARNCSSRIIGKKAALNADFAAIQIEGEIKFALLHDLASIDAQKALRLKKALAAS